MRHTGSLLPAVVGSGVTTNGADTRGTAAAYVAYYRVSTDQQGVSGLGLEAQQVAIARFLGSRPLLAAYTEIESGRRDRNRPQLHAALADCRRRKAVLVIAKLDRLSRDLAFIANLMNSKMEFVAVDMPLASRLTIHILAAVAEHEREMISQRTKAAMERAKARGVKLGNPRWADALTLARVAQGVQPCPTELLAEIQRWRAEGVGLRAIARRLTHLHVPTLTGKATWHPMAIKRIVDTARRTTVTS